MKFYTYFFGLSIVIGLCGALPIPSVEIGVAERNMFMIGAVAFLSFGAVIAGCVCCRRRKKGFELNHEKDNKEFTNESGTLESNKSEYPIFRALSAENQQKINESQASTSTSIIIENVVTQPTSVQPRRKDQEFDTDPIPSAVVVSIPVVNSSNERLITDDYNNDNNNGPISAADLENIENNNAVEYIRNQNEIGIVIEPSQYSRNRNIHVNPSNELNLEQRITIAQNENNTETEKIVNNTSTTDIRIEIEEYNNTNNKIPIEYSQTTELNDDQSYKISYNDNLSFVENNALQDFAISSSTDFIDDNFSTNTDSITQNNEKIVESQNIYKNEILPNQQIQTKINEKQQTILENEISFSSSVTNPIINSTSTSKINYNILNSNKNNENSIDTKHIVQETVPTSINIDEESSKLINNKLNLQNHSDSGNNLDYNTIVSLTETLNEIELEKRNEYNELEKRHSEDSAIEESVNIVDSSSNNILTELRDETCSIKSESSDKSNETGSVEEALRALDIAIGDDPASENCSGGEEDDISNYKTQMYQYNKNELEDEDLIPYENVIRDLLVTKGMGLNGLIIPKNLNISDEEKIEVETVNEIEKQNEVDNFHDSIKSEAIELVEGIIEQSRLIVEEQYSLSTFDKKFIPETEINQSFIVNYALIEHQNPIIHMNGHVTTVSEVESKIENYDIIQKENQKTEILNSFSPKSNLKKLKSVESLECLFESEFLPSTSTPCIQNKFQNKFIYDPKTKTNNGIKLFDCDNEELQNGEQNSMELLSNNSVEDIINDNNKISPIANATFNANATYNANDKTYNANATYDAVNDIKSNETFDKTYDAIPNIVVKENDFTYPGDPCSSKQAIERDEFLKPLIRYQREEITSEELNTITPVNTPIELDYNQETWDKMTKNNEDVDYPRSGWFLHPQDMITGHMTDENTIVIETNRTFDLENKNEDVNAAEEEEEDAENLELTFDMLRKQLAEVLPQPQGVVGPIEYSDDEEEQNEENRTFDEYRSPLDGIIGLLENEIEPPAVAPNEVFINYKRTLSPIMEESETEETCKTFVMNETKCLDSTSTGCVETGEAIMGVTKTLMASNDTLFNFEDTLGDKEDSTASPRLSSQCDSQATTPVKSFDNRSTASSIATTITTSSDTEKGGTDNKQKSSLSSNALNDYTIIIPDRRSPPKTLAFSTDSQYDSYRSDAVAEFCSPVEQKTFSEGTASTSDRVSSDISPTLDNETTFTMNTIDDKTCVTVIIKDDERISEISEPEWGSTASFNIGPITNNVQAADGGDMNTCDMNSLTDVPSLDFNVNTFDKEFDVANNESENSHSVEESVSECLEKNKPIIIEAISGPLIIISAPNDKTSLDEETTTESSNCLDDLNNQEEEITNRIDSGHDDSGHSTQLSMDDKSNNTSHNISAQETDSIGDSPYCKQLQQQNQQQQLKQQNKHVEQNVQHFPVKATTEQSNKFNCKEFLSKEIEYSATSQQNLKSLSNYSNTTQILENGYANLTQNPLNSSNSVDDIFHLEYSKENSDPNIKKLYQDSNIGGNLTDHHNHQNNIHHSADRMREKLIANGVDNVTGGNIGIGVYSNKVQISNGHQDAVIKMDKNIGINEHEKTSNVYNNSNELTCSLIMPSNKTDDDIMVAEDVINHLSGEEDPWVETIHDIRFPGPGHPDMLSTSFTTASNSTSEWDSDVDDSHSSEEFMYVRGSSANNAILNYIKQESSSNDDEEDSHLKDKFKVGSADDDLVSEASSSEYEGEFVPSSWDSMAQPSRSALKSPDKNNQGSDKKRRNVVFKKQRYHSVYEYPRESLSLSPAYSEPILSTRKEFYSYSNKNSLEEFDDGFIVSSSMRPFHGGSQFNACYTWPTDSDFSWSQVDDITNFNTEQNLATYNEIKWIHPMNEINDKVNIESPNKIEDIQRPDSGVGESAEMLSERQSLGELCHAKTKLRLPIEEFTTPQIFNQFSNKNFEIQNDKSQELKNTSVTIKPSYINKDDDEPVTQFIPESIVTTEKDVADSMMNKTNKMNFSTFGKRNHIDNDEITISCNNEKQKRIAPKTILKYRQIKPAINIILIDDISGTQDTFQDKEPTSAEICHNNCITDSNPTYFRNKTIIINNNERNHNNVKNETTDELILKSEKIRQSDSTDEDSGIESIMKLNNRIESD